MSLKKFIIYITACKHTTRLPTDALLGHPFSCLVCHATTTIVDIHTCEYHAYCTKKKCSFGAWTGLSPELAEQAANRHAMNSGHTDTAKTEYVPNPIAVQRLEFLKRNGIL